MLAKRFRFRRGLDIECSSGVRGHAEYSAGRNASLYQIAGWTQRQSEELAVSICPLSERVRFALFRYPRYNKVSHRTRSIRPVYLRKALWLLEQSGILRMVAT